MYKSSNFLWFLQVNDEKLVKDWTSKVGQQISCPAIVCSATEQYATVINEKVRDFKCTEKNSILSILAEIRGCTIIIIIILYFRREGTTCIHSVHSKMKENRH